MLKIIIDSTCDVSDEFIKDNNLELLPLQIFIDGVLYRDRVNITSEMVYDAIRTNKDLKTSLPVYADMHDLFEKYAKEGQDFILFTFSRKLSGTYAAAYQIVKELKEKYKTNMAVIDSTNGGFAHALVVRKFIELKKDKMSFEELVKLGNDLASKVETIFLVNDLTQLRKSGRISSLKSLVGSLLNIKPILYIGDGSIKVFKNAIGQKRALRELLNYVNLNTKDKKQLIGLNYITNKPLLEETIRLLNKSGFKNLDTAVLSSVMTVHIGLDAIAIAFFRD